MDGIDPSRWSPEVRAIAFYLPQYHPIPENDAWWGKGFTEWANVTKAYPIFRGHQQPHLPTDLGFYDLRLPEAREAQADLARTYGIHGFCYYHYWFNGRRVLERPFREVLASGRPDFPFCLCWANENWTRRWDGMDQDVLLTQDYSAQDDRAHLRSLAPAFEDPRYVRVDGKPLFIVYRSTNLPDPRHTTDIWRKEARRHGLGELFLARLESIETEKLRSPEDGGFDASIEFAPDWKCHGPLLRRSWAWDWARRLRLTGHEYMMHLVFDYRELARLMAAKPLPTHEFFRCVTPSWDNSARRALGAQIFVGATPQLYQEWLTKIVEQARSKLPQRRIVFINAWNEWAEGNHLEPCRRWGRAYLEATRRSLESE